MQVFTVMFHTGSEDVIVNVLSSGAAAKKCAEDCAATLYPANKFDWNGHFLTCEDRYEEWSVQEWGVKE